MAQSQGDGGRTSQPHLSPLPAGQTSIELLGKSLTKLVYEVLGTSSNERLPSGQMDVSSWETVSQEKREEDPTRGHGQRSVEESRSHFLLPDPPKLFFLGLPFQDRRAS